MVLIAVAIQTRLVRIAWIALNECIALCAIGRDRRKEIMNRQRRSLRKSNEICGQRKAGDGMNKGICFT